MLDLPNVRFGLRTGRCSRLARRRSGPLVESSSYGGIPIGISKLLAGTRVPHFSLWDSMIAPGRPLLLSLTLSLVAFLPMPVSASQQGSPPAFQPEDLSSEIALANYVDRFLAQDRMARELLNPSNVMLFSEGYRPRVGIPNDPEAAGSRFDQLRSFFIRKLYLDLRSVSPFTQERLEAFIDQIGTASDTTVICAGEIAVRHNFRVEGRFNFQRELRKVPPGSERETFKNCWLNDAVLGTELRIIAWMYEQLYGEPYVPPHRRSGSS